MSDAAEGSPARLRWDRGGEGWVESISDDAVVVRSTAPWPPGALVGGALVPLAGEDEALRVRVKVHSCRRDPEHGQFVVRARLVDLTRTQRRRLEERLAAAHPSARL